LCFAVHPQLPLYAKQEGEPNAVRESTRLFEELVSAGKVDAIGEAGFDLFNADFRETEPEQDALFHLHLDAALKTDLPLVLHLRHAIHKIFPYIKELRRLRSLVFHSYSGGMQEALSLLKRGVNAYFSFGTTILKGHKEALRCVTLLPEDRLLTETDAPWQPLPNTTFSSFDTLALVREKALALRLDRAFFAGLTPPSDAAAAFERQIDRNFATALLK
jgi:TatD DNase family protein